jgi:hypothetical protein
VLGSSPRQRDVVIDEIHRVPELLNVVHDLIESGPPKRYVLTESSARKLRQSGVDLLVAGPPSGQRRSAGSIALSPEAAEVPHAGTDGIRAGWLVV